MGTTNTRQESQQLSLLLCQIDLSLGFCQIWRKKEQRKQILGFQSQNRIRRAEFERCTVVLYPRGGVWVGCGSVTISLLAAALVSLERIRSSPEPSFPICQRHECEEHLSSKKQNKGVLCDWEAYVLLPFVGTFDYCVVLSNVFPLNSQKTQNL